jgi:cytochrome oxidase assembly protein ShyY1
VSAHCAIKNATLYDFYVHVVGKWQLKRLKKKLEEKTGIVPRK